MPMLPIMLRLQNKRCVIVGGGRVAARKLIALHAALAQITVISPQLCDEFRPYLGDPSITFLNGCYTSDLLANLRPLLVFAATDDSAVNRQVLDDAHTIGALVDLADDANASDFHSMAAVQRGSLTFAISSEGTSPALTRHARERLEILFGDEYTTFSLWLETLRPLIRDQYATQAERGALWDRLMESDVLTYLRHGNEANARALVWQITGIDPLPF